VKLREVLSSLESNPYLDVFDLYGVLKGVRDGRYDGTLDEWKELARYFFGDSLSFTSIEEVKYALTSLLDKVSRDEGGLVA